MKQQILHTDKILHHFDKVQYWLQGGNPYPVTAELSMTNACNHACPACAGMRGKDKSVMIERGMARMVISDLALGGTKAIMFTGGGEPLVYPDCTEMVALAANKGMDVGFVTNGGILGENTARMLVDKCKWIRVSVDADGPDIYNLSHGMDVEEWLQLLYNLRMLVAIKRECLSPVTLGYAYLTSQKTAIGMVPATRQAKDLGFDYIQFRPYYHDFYDIIGSGQWSKCKKHESGNFKVICSYNKYSCINEMNRRNHGYARPYDKCYGQNFATAIGADAKVYVCCLHVDDPDMCLGDLRKDTFHTIWNSERRRDVMAQMSLKKCTPMCRYDPFNKILWALKQPKEHVNFL